MDYIEKMQNMLSNGYSMDEVAENLYLNYHSVINTDEVYRLRKAIAKKYNCNLNDVKLIGSAHTGYTYKDGKLQKRDNPKDYDFAIINADIFIRFFHMVDVDKIVANERRMYIDGILHGKFHPLHAGQEFLRKLEKKNATIMKELEVSKHVSVCFYLSEKDFIDGLVNYNSELYAGELRRISEQKDEKEVMTVGIGKLVSFSDLKNVDKMEE
jgi:hypothetical protein